MRARLPFLPPFSSLFKDFSLGPQPRQAPRSDLLKQGLERAAGGSNLMKKQRNAPPVLGSQVNTPALLWRGEEQMICDWKTGRERRREGESGAGGSRGRGGGGSGRRELVLICHLASLCASWATRPPFLILISTCLYNFRQTCRAAETYSPGSLKINTWAPTFPTWVHGIGRGNPLTRWVQAHCDSHFSLFSNSLSPAQCGSPELLEHQVWEEDSFPTFSVTCTCEAGGEGGRREEDWGLLQERINRLPKTKQPRLIILHL